MLCKSNENCVLILIGQLYDLVAMYCMEEDKEELDLFDFILHKLDVIPVQEMSL